SLQGYVNGRWVRSNAQTSMDMPVKRVHPEFPFHNVALLDTPALAKSPFRTVSDIDVSALKYYVYELALDSAPLAMNEMSFKAKDAQGRTVDLHWIGNGQYLKVISRDHKQTSVRLFASRPREHSNERLPRISAYPASLLWEQVARARQHAILD